MISCPYCRHDLTPLHNDITAEHKQGTSVVMLCVDCGEVLFATARAFRKPTKKESKEIEDSGVLANARATWKVVSDNGNENPRIVDALWEHYKATYLDDQLMLDIVKNNDDLINVAHVIFYSGFSVATGHIRQMVQESSSRGEFIGRMLLLSAELNAYEAAGRSAMVGKKRRGRHTLQ